MLPAHQQGCSLMCTEIHTWLLACSLPCSTSPMTHVSTGHGLQVVTDFFDELKSRTAGYASMDFTMIGYRQSDLQVRLHDLVWQSLLPCTHAKSLLWP